MRTGGASAGLASVRGREDRPGLAVGLCLFVFICFTGIDTSAKWLMESGLPVGEVVFIRYLGHLFFVVALFAPSQGANLWRMKKPRLTLLRGTMLLLATASNFTALQYLPLTVTTSIFFASPLIITALAAIFLAEKVGPRRWAAICVGFAGVLIITRPWGASFHWAMLISCIPPIAASIYTLITRRLAGEEAPDTMQFWAALIPVIALAPFAFLDWTWPSDGWGWVFFFCIGFFGWLGHQLFTVAHRFADASVLAPLTYIHIVYITASSWLIFHQPPAFWTIIGAGVIIASGLYVWLRERKAGAGG
ncbi:MAG: DMT family transporter [Pseudomonadota bacterium]